MHALMERLLEAWSECTPSQLSDAPEAASAACCRSLLICARRLLDRLPPGDVNTVTSTCRLHIVGTDRAAARLGELECRV